MWDLVRVVRNTPWDFEIGDSTPMGWLTVALYFACASVCSWNAVQSYRAGGVRGRPTAFWTGLALAMTLLGINKQLDIQSWFTAVGRGLAEAQGWYEQRRAVQAVLVGAGVLLGLGIGGAAAYVWRHSLRKDALAWVGLLFVGAFVVTRAASFHHVDRLLGFEMLGVRVNWVLEIGGILIVCVGAISSLRRDRATLRPRRRSRGPRRPRDPHRL